MRFNGNSFAIRKKIDGFSKPLYSVIVALAAFASFWLLAYAMRSLPLGTAYPVWVGIGAIGSFIIGIVVFGESASAMRIASAPPIAVWRSLGIHRNLSRPGFPERQELRQR